MNVESALVAVDDLVSNRYQPRDTFVEEEIEELAASIREVGLLHPPLVRPILGSKTFEIIAGERRVKACRYLGYEKIPVLVRKEATHFTAAKAALIENMQRVDLNPIEVAKSIKTLIEEFSCTQEELALKIGKKRSTVANFLRLLQLPQAMQEALVFGSISMAHAKVLLSCREPFRQELFKMMQDQNITVRKAEELVVMYQKVAEKKIQKRVLGDDQLFLQEQVVRLERHFGTKVEIRAKKNKGIVTIHFYNLDDLERVLDCIV